MIKKWGFFLVFFFVPLFFNSNDTGYEHLVERALWVNQTYEAMSLDQRLGQLFMVRAYSKGEIEHERYIEDLIRK